MLVDLVNDPTAPADQIRFAAQQLLPFDSAPLPCPPRVTAANALRRIAEDRTLDPHGRRRAAQALTQFGPSPGPNPLDILAQLAADPDIPPLQRALAHADLATLHPTQRPAAARALLAVARDTTEPTNQPPPTRRRTAHQPRQRHPSRRSRTPTRAHHRHQHEPRRTRTSRTRHRPPGRHPPPHRSRGANRARHHTPRCQPTAPDRRSMGSAVPRTPTRRHHLPPEADHRPHQPPKRSSPGRRCPRTRTRTSWPSGGISRRNRR
jgi:hypothetical protein